MHALLEEHLRELEPHSPPESRHALDLSGLRRPEVSFWTIWDGNALAGCGALKELSPTHAELKSMRTAKTHQRRGVASQLLEHLVAEAKRRGYERLSLETGSMDYFAPAHRLYARFGFTPCAIFGDYAEDPNSLFLSLDL